jgi:hypothetical protein
VLAGGELVEQHVALALLERLHEDLLGDVGDDAPELLEVDRLLVLEGADLAGHAVDGQGEFADRVEALLRGLDQGALDVIDDDVLVDAALARGGVDQAHEFNEIHGLPRGVVLVQVSGAGAGSRWMAGRTGWVRDKKSVSPGAHARYIHRM